MSSPESKDSIGGHEDYSAIPEISKLFMRRKDANSLRVLEMAMSSFIS
jgi:hypothetical protein